MVVYPKDRQDEITLLLRRDEFRWSRVTTSRVFYQGQEYMRVVSNDLNLLAEIRKMYSINRDPQIMSM